MNNMLLNICIYLFEFICGQTKVEEQNQEKSYDSYFLYDLETFESCSLYEYK